MPGITTRDVIMFFAGAAFAVVSIGLMSLMRTV